MVCIGERVYVRDKGNGTVRWLGKLSGLTSERAGIELDEPSESCHDGKYMGTEIFACGANCGIFIKSDKIDRGISLVDAINERYVKNKKTPDEHTTTRTGKSSIPTPILVGEEEAQRYFTENLFDLAEISVDQAPVSSLGAEQELIKFTKLDKLSLRNNLLADVDSISRICQLIPSMRTIDISGSCFIENSNTSYGGVNHVKTLIAVGCRSAHLKRDIVAAFPVLEELVIDGTGDLLANLISLPNSLKKLSIKAISGFKDFGELGLLISRILSSKLECLEASKNMWLTDLKGMENLDWMSDLKDLDISDCCIGSWKTISLLSESIKSLNSLRVTGNTFYEAGSSRARQILISLFPHLVALNNATISLKLREQAELYCANLLAREDAFVSLCIPKYRIRELVERFKCSEDSGTELMATQISSKILTSSLFKLTVIAVGPPVNIKVPKSCRVSDLIKIVASKISWPLKLCQLRLHASPSFEMIESTPLDDLNCEIADFGIDDGWFVFTSVSEG